MEINSKKILLPLLLFVVFLILGACSSVVSENSDSTDKDDSDWAVPSDQIFVGTGRDAIPAIDNPSFADVSSIDFLDPEDLVLGIKIEGKIKAYPHLVLDYHEIVNDEIANVPVSVTYCPLTGSGIAWKRVVNGQETTFGVSGLIYKNNLIAYDRETRSSWSQMMIKGINGTFKGDTLQTFPLVQMNWEAWKKAYPQSQVLQGIKESDTNYRFSAYGNYSSDNGDILFPIEKEDDRLERKTLAHGVLYNSSLNVFPVEAFPEKFGVVNTTLGFGKKVVIAGSSKHNLVVSYSREMDDGTVLTFLPISEELPVIMGDSEGNEWNVFGKAVSGPRKGEQLKTIPSYNAYWFAWADFFGFGPKRPRIVYP